MHEHETTTSPERSVLGRRTILKGAAWSVPAVLAVGATPAFAVSLTFAITSRSPKNVNNGQGYDVTVNGNGVTGRTVTLSAPGGTSLTTGNVDLQGHWSARINLAGAADGIVTITASQSGGGSDTTTVKKS